jgi:hypothetical protein
MNFSRSAGGARSAAIRMDSLQPSVEMAQSSNLMGERDLSDDDMRSNDEGSDDEGVTAVQKGKQNMV